MRLKEIKPGMVIHCKTEEEKEILIGELDRLGYVWCTGDRVVHLDVSQKVDTVCYFVGSDKKVTWSFCSEKSSKTITEFSDLIIPEISAKEVLETIGEICTRSVSCTSGDSCPLYRSGNQNLCSNKMLLAESEKVVAICTKWREEHPKEEKKELETEWVYVVRIIKVHDNGKKECVHEVDLTKDEHIGEYPLLEDFVTEQLKKYCSEHEGNFFAVYEHICRIKE